MLLSIIIAVILFALIVSVGPHLLNAILIVLYFYGVWKSFQAHWVFGLVALFILPVGVVIGLFSLVARRNVAKALLGKS